MFTSFTFCHLELQNIGVDKNFVCFLIFHDNYSINAEEKKNDQKTKKERICVFTELDFEICLN